MNATEEIIMHYTGENIEPGRIRSKEIADVIAAVEEMIAATVIEERDDLKKSDVIVGLARIEPGSLRLIFQPVQPTLTQPALRKVSSAIIQEDFEELSKGVVDAISELAKFARRHNSTGELLIRDGEEQLLAKITPELDVRQLPHICGETTIYGSVKRIGGERPGARVEILSGETITCIMTEKIARRLAHKLYDFVGLSGTAYWNATTLALERFEVDSITEYEDTPIDEAVQSLADVAAPYFTDIDDVDRYVAALRSDTFED